MQTPLYVLEDPDKAEVQGHLAYVHALAHQVRKIYFIGGFINMELMRRYLYQEINERNFARPEVNRNLHPTTKSPIISTPGCTCFPELFTVHLNAKKLGVQAPQ